MPEAEAEEESELKMIESQETKSECDSTKKMETPLVLEPDHPMMQRFQKALKKHLERLKSKLSEEVLDLDSSYKEKEKEKTEVGVELYAMQQELFRQHSILEKHEDAMEKLMKEREGLDDALKAQRSQWKEAMEKLNEAKKKEQELSIELHKLSLLEKQLEKWESDMDSSLAVSQRITEKAQADKSKIIEEKRKMDMHMLRLMTEVTKLEDDIKFMNAELDIKWEEKAILHQTLTDANADFQALIDEQKRLFAAWNAVITTMTQRDTVYTNVSKELSECQQAFKTLNAEIEGFKKFAKEAMKRNEQLSITYGRILGEKENADAHMKSLTAKKQQFECQNAILAATIGETEKELERMKTEVETVNSQLILRGTECNKLNTKRQEVEDKILSFLQDQMLNDKTALYLNKSVKELREKCRREEFFLIERENKISKQFVEIEVLKGNTERNNQIIMKMNKELEQREQELKCTENEINKCQMTVMQKQGSYAVLLKKIERQMEKMGTTKPGQHPIHGRIAELEKINSEMQEKNDKMQSFWLVQQNNNVRLTNQRREQLKDLNLLRKQVTVLLQKALKTELEIEKEAKIGQEVNKSIAALQHKMTELNRKLSGKKDHSQILDRKNSLMQANFVQMLKESELEQIKLKAEVNELETSIEELAETMLEVQREMLAWERRIKMANETKDSIMKERSSEGEITQMKAEIHRMEVRYDQLKKVQEKLVTDMEMSVLHRDGIMEVSSAKEKRQSQSFNTRYMMQKKIDNVKNRIKGLQNEGINIEKTVKHTRLEQEDLQRRIKEKGEKLISMNDKTKILDVKMEDVKLSKQQNLEILIRRQKKCKMYNQARQGQHKLLHKNELVIDSELQSERSLNADLESISESLLKDFPTHRFSLMKILNTIRAKPA